MSQNTLEPNEEKEPEWKKKVKNLSLSAQASVYSHYNELKNASREQAINIAMDILILYVETVNVKSLLQRGRSNERQN